MNVRVDQARQQRPFMAGHQAVPGNLKPVGLNPDDQAVLNQDGRTGAPE